MIVQDIRDYSRRELEELLPPLGEKRAHAAALFKSLHRNGARTIRDMAGVPEKLKDKLSPRYSITPAPVEEKQVSRLDGTIRLLFKFHDGAVAESVVLSAAGRTAACLSSQSGCACGCAFCATARLGLKRSLAPHEILDQFSACLRAAGGRLDSLVFMGMGEPFLNWANVKKSVLLLSDGLGRNFPQSKMTVSTVGIIPVIDELADSPLKINLALSVITADAGQRTALAPMEKKYPLREILKAAGRYCAKTKRLVFLEYILFGGLNDSLEDAEKFAGLIRGLPCTVNLIPYNRSGVEDFVPAQPEKAKEFKRTLMARGIRTYLRAEKGSDIGAACGQLAARQSD